MASRKIRFLMFDAIKINGFPSIMIHFHLRKEESYPQIESALAIWLNLAVGNNITITTDILKQKTKDFNFAVLFDIEHFTGSAGRMSGLGVVIMYNHA